MKLFTFFPLIVVIFTIQLHPSSSQYHQSYHQQGYVVLPYTPVVAITENDPMQNYNMLQHQPHVQPESFSQNAVPFSHIPSMMISQQPHPQQQINQQIYNIPLQFQSSPYHHQIPTPIQQQIQPQSQNYGQPEIMMTPPQQFLQQPIIPNQISNQQIQHNNLISDYASGSWFNNNDNTNALDFNNNNANGPLRGSIFNHNGNRIANTAGGNINFNNNNGNDGFEGAVFNHNDNGVRVISFNHWGFQQHDGNNINANNNNDNQGVVGSINNHNSNGGGGQMGFAGPYVYGTMSMPTQLEMHTSNTNFNNNNANNGGRGSVFNYNSNG